MTTPFTDAFPPRQPFPPWEPGTPKRPGQPWPSPGPPGRSPSPAAAPTQVWAQPGEWPGRLYERLLDQRIVMAHGRLDQEAATRLCAQLLTLDAEGPGPIRLEMQNLDADLPAALTVMGVLDTLRAAVIAHAGGRIRGPALGLLAASGQRRAYPSALFTLSEPRVGFEGTAHTIAAQEEQFRAMLDDLYARLAGVTGREVDDIRADARRERSLTVGEAIDYGLIEGHAGPPGVAVPAPGERRD